MPKEYDNNMRGVLFLNDRKVKETHPDYKGTVTIDGREYWLSGWRKQHSERGAFVSLAVQAKEPKPEKSGDPFMDASLGVGAGSSPANADQPFDDDIPF